MANDGTDGTGGNLSRRKLLALTSAGAAAGLAGCQGDDGGGDPTDSPTTGGDGTTTGTTDGTSEGTTETTTEQETTLSADQMADAIPDSNEGDIPQDMNWNRYSNGPLISFWNWDYTSRTYWNNYTDYWLLQEDGFSYDSDSMTGTYELKEDYSYWWNGDRVTGEDWWMQNEIERLQDPEGSAYESIEMQDDYTVTFTRKEKINPILLGNGGGRIMDYRGIWRQWLEQFQDASSADERKATLQELTNWEITTQEFMDEGLGNGTYRLTDFNTQEFLWEKFDDHPFADQTPFEQMRFRVASGSAQNQQITNDQLDWGNGKFPANLRSQSPEYLQTLYEKKSIQSRNLLFNYKNKHIGRRNVRRALVSILDFTHLVDLWKEEGGFVKEVQTGLPQALENKWLGSEMMGQMIKYPIEADEERANQFMEDAGYSKQGGTWIGPDGDPLNFRLSINSGWAAYVTLGKAINQSWKQWGANSELISQEASTWTGNVTSVNDWDVTIWLHGFDSLHPVNYYNIQNQYHMRLGNSVSQVQEWVDAGETHSQLNGRPISLTIPSEPGQLEVGDGGREINIFDLVQELKVAQSEDRSREIIRTLATYWNYDLPIYDMFPQVAAGWGDTEDFQWPDDPDVWYQKASRAMYATWRKGLVDPVPTEQ